VNSKLRHMEKVMDQLALLKAKDRVFSINQVLNDDTEPCMTPRRNRCNECKATIQQGVRYCKGCSNNLVYSHDLYEVALLGCGCKKMACMDCQFEIPMHFKIYGCDLACNDHTPQNIQVWKCKGRSFLTPKPAPKPPVHDWYVPARDNYNWVQLMMPSDYRTR
jgi:hypothetical protein